MTIRGCVCPSVRPSVCPWIINVLRPARSVGAAYVRPGFIYTLIPFVRLADVHGGIRKISPKRNDAGGVNDKSDFFLTMFERHFSYHCSWRRICFVSWFSSGRIINLSHDVINMSLIFFPLTHLLSSWQLHHINVCY